MNKKIRNRKQTILKYNYTLNKMLNEIDNGFFNGYNFCKRYKVPWIFITAAIQSNFIQKTTRNKYKTLITNSTFEIASKLAKKRLEINEKYLTL